MSRKNDIRILPDRIVHLADERRRRRQFAKQPKVTGYMSECRLINTKHCREFRFTADFVREKLQTGLILTFAPFSAEQALKAEEETGEERHRTGIMIQPVPPEYMKRTSVAHIRRRFLGLFSRFPYYATLDTVPEPCEVLNRMRMDPSLPSATFFLEEWIIQDDMLGEIKGYKLKLKHPF
jgi:hypothetical protein